MSKISYTGCIELSPVILAQFTLEICIAAGNCKKNMKTRIFGVQGHNVGIPRKLISSACYDKQPASLCQSATVCMVDEPMPVE